MTRRGLGLLVAAALACARPAAAQQPAAPPRDSAAAVDTTGPAADTTGPAVAPRDTLAPPDSLSPDSFLSTMPRLGAPPGPLPRAGRVVFDRDALWSTGALTLGELLQRIPGVFLVRGGWFGQPEVVEYAGQGASSVELFLDGFALDPLGADSTGYDLSQIDLGLLKRVEVEVLPTVLRVYLFSDDRNVRHPRTETAFATGDASTNTYLIRYLNRWKGGAGLGLAVSSLATGSGLSGAAGSTQLALWGKGSWTPSPQLGVAYEAYSVSDNRNPLGINAAGGPGGSRTHRTDLFLRGYAATRADGMGLRFDALAGSSTYTDSTSGLNRDALQGAAILAYRAPRWSTELTARIRDASVPFELQLRAAAAPLGPLTMSATLDRRTLLGGRHTLDASLVAGFRPWAPLALYGAVRARNTVAAPVIATDTTQRVIDFDAGIALTTRPLDLDVSFTRHGDYAPPVGGSFGPSALVYPDVGVRTATVAFALRPTLFLTLAGWYRRPLDPATSAYEPPDHSFLSATFRSRLLPVLRRGAFDLVAQVAMEGWGRGVIGDSLGAAIPLGGATIVDYRIQFRLVNATIFWTLRNALASRYALVPGIPMPAAAQRYGVRWQFTN